MEPVTRKKHTFAVLLLGLFVTPLGMAILGCTPSADNPSGRTARSSPTVTTDTPDDVVPEVLVPEEVQPEPVEPVAAGPPEQIDVKVKGPEQVTVGQTARFQVKLSNRGFEPASDLSMQISVSQQIEGMDESVGQWIQEPDLAAGKSHSLEPQFRAVAPGEAWIRVKLVYQRTTTLADVTCAVTVVPDSGPPAISESPTTEPSTEEKPAKSATIQPTSAQSETPEPEAQSTKSEKPRDLGPPLVENVKKLRRLNPEHLAWIDPEKKQVVMMGEVCAREAPLEMFACPRGTKEHEAVVSIRSKAYLIHAGLLAVGAKPGAPVQFQPKYVPARGDEIEITVRWKDKDGKQHSAKAQDWVRDQKTQKALSHPWVFAGSGFWKDPETGTEHYQAESGDFICVSNFPSAMLDLPIPSTDTTEGLLFEAFTERIPPLGTPVTVILAPKTKTDTKPPVEKDKEKTTEKKAG
ncbi:MAG: hypothetical protein JW818_12105 [Pirellulales bacterium]|nr:hypothetical protein [Pirellulales bacterium]